MPGTCATCRDAKPMCKTRSGSASWLSTGWCGPRLCRPSRSASRDLTRYRKAQIDERGREAQRLDKVLQDAGIKLSSVGTDILGKSGRDMLMALVSGTRDPQVLAELARGRLRTKIPLLRRALEGRFVSHHRPILKKSLAKLAFLDETIEDLSAEIDRLIAPFAAEVDLLDTITGVDRRAAECIIAEIGIDMARFGSSAPLARWGGRRPGHHESAGKHKSGRSRPGSKWLAATLAHCAEAAGRSKGTYLGAQFQRLRGRRGHAKARKAVEHSILVTAYHVLDRHVPYQDLGADWFAHRRPEAHARRLAQQIEALGFRVTIEPTEQAA